MREASNRGVEDVETSERKFTQPAGCVTPKSEQERKEQFMQKKRRSIEEKRPLLKEA